MTGLSPDRPLTREPVAGKPFDKPLGRHEFVPRRPWAAWRNWLLLPLLLLAAVGLALFLSQGRAPVGSLVLYGNVDIREVQSAFDDNGRIMRMLVHEGQAVKEGELIATLDDTRYQAALAAAEGEMQSARATLEKLLAGSRPEEIAEARATMEALRVTYENDRTNWQRYQSAARTGAGSLADRDNARAALDSARERFEAARQVYLLAVEGPRIEDIEAARANLKAAAARVALVRRELVDTKLYAPSDGVVEDRILEPGDMASPGTPVFTIALTSPLWVRAYVPESGLGHVALGMAARVTTDSFPGRVYHGWIGYLSPSAEFTPRNVETPELRTALVYQLRVYVCDARGELRLGMPATVQIDLAKSTEGAGPPPGCGPDGPGGS